MAGAPPRQRLQHLVVMLLRLHLMKMDFVWKIICHRYLPFVIFYQACVH